MLFRASASRAATRLPRGLSSRDCRGIERKEIFVSDDERTEFLDRLSESVRRSGAGLYAWCLMPNHFHLFLRTAMAPLSRLLQGLLGGYADFFNRRHDRSGHLFQNRFKSTLVEAERYGLELVRYIHLNPVRSRLGVSVDDLDEYPWTGHAVLLGKRSLEAQDTGFVLEQFGRATGAARAAYRAFVRAAAFGGGSGWPRPGRRWAAAKRRKLGGCPDLATGARELGLRRAGPGKWGLRGSGHCRTADTCGGGDRSGGLAQSPRAARL